MDETKTSAFSFKSLKGLFKKSNPSNSYDLERKNIMKERNLLFLLVILMLKQISLRSLFNI